MPTKEEHEIIKKLLRLQNLQDSDIIFVEQLVDKFSDIFFIQGDKLPTKNVLKHEILVTNQVMIRIKQFRHPPILKEEINRQVKELWTNEIFEHSTSAYSALIFCVDKKPDSAGNKRYRMAIDYRKHPLHNIADTPDQLGVSLYFSVFDLASGYHQIEIKKEHRHKTAFASDLGLFQFHWSLFGLKNSVPVFLSLIVLLISGMKRVVSFFDDICVPSTTLEER